MFQVEMVQNTLQLQDLKKDLVMRDPLKESTYHVLPIEDFLGQILDVYKINIP